MIFATYIDNLGFASSIPWTPPSSGSPFIPTPTWTDLDNALNRINANITPGIFRSTTHFDNLFNGISTVFGTFTPSKIWATPFSWMNAQFIPGTQAILWPMSVDDDVKEDNAIHELTHALRSSQEYYLLFNISREEGISYSTASVYYPAGKLGFTKLETKINSLENCSHYSTPPPSLVSGWKNAWYLSDYRLHTKTMNYASGLWSVTVSLTAEDWQNMENAHRIDISCAELASKYNDLLKAKGCCFRFTCNKYATSIREIPIGNDIPTGEE